MDPQETVDEMVLVAMRVLNDEPSSERTVLLAELVLAYAEWRAKGGWEPRWSDALERAR